MELDPQPSLAATGDLTSGQAARLRSCLLPFHLTRPSVPSALTSRRVLVSMLHGAVDRRPFCTLWATRTTAAPGPSGTNSLFGRDTKAEQRPRELAATTNTMRSRHLSAHGAVSERAADGSSGLARGAETVPGARRGWWVGWAHPWRLHGGHQRPREKNPKRTIARNCLKAQRARRVGGELLGEI